MNADVPVLGILLLDTRFPRIPGDVGNEDSYAYPVRLKTVAGATVQRVIYEADPALLELFVAAAQELAAEGVAALTSSCGFLTPLQEEVARAVEIPVFLSSLVQVPLAHALTGRRVGIITANAHHLSDRVLENAGIGADIPVAIRGLEDAAAFRDPILQGDSILDREQIEREVVARAARLVQDQPEIGAIVLECHNLAPYAHAVRAATGRPVLDIIDFANWVYSSIQKKTYPR